jgi:hypothetical protein
MSIFGIGQKSEIKVFATDLAEQIAKRYPPALDSQPGKRPSVNRLTRITEDACTKAVEYHDAKKLGWFSRARLGNHFRWALTELGYTKEFVDFATEAVVVHISRKR